MPIFIDGEKIFEITVGGTDVLEVNVGGTEKIFPEAKATISLASDVSEVPAAGGPVVLTATFNPPGGISAVIFQSAPKGTTTWTTIQNSTSLTCNTTATADTDYRALGRDNYYPTQTQSSSGTVTVDVVAVPVAPTITPTAISQTTNFTSDVPMTVTNPVAGNQYRWQARPSSGGTVVNLTGYVTDGINYTWLDSDANFVDGGQIRVNTRDSVSQVANSAWTTASIAPAITPGLTSNKTNFNEGETATFTANTNGGVAPYTYLWQENTGSGWVNIPGAPTTNVYNRTTVYPGDDGLQVRVRVTDQNGANPISGPITINVEETLAATVSPAGTAVTEGDTTNFTTNVTGGAPTAYQWQQNVNSGGWTNISGATAATYNRTWAAGDVGTVNIRCVIQANYSQQITPASGNWTVSSAGVALDVLVEQLFTGSGVTNMGYYLCNETSGSLQPLFGSPGPAQARQLVAYSRPGDPLFPDETTSVCSGATSNSTSGAANNVFDNRTTFIPSGSQVPVTLVCAFQHTTANMAAGVFAVMNQNGRTGISIEGDGSTNKVRLANRTNEVGLTGITLNVGSWNFMTVSYNPATNNYNGQCNGVAFNGNFNLIANWPSGTSLPAVIIGQGCQQAQLYRTALGASISRAGAAYNLELTAQQHQDLWNAYQQGG